MIGIITFFLLAKICLGQNDAVQIKNEIKVEKVSSNITIEHEIEKFKNSNNTLIVKNKLIINSKTVELNEWDSYYISNNKKYVVYIKHFVKENKTRAYHQVLLEDTGKELWKEEIERIGRDVVFTYVVSNFGYVARLCGKDLSVHGRRVELIDKTGKLMGSFAVDWKNIFNIYANTAQFAKNSNNLFFFILYNENEKEQIQLLGFDKNFKEIYRKSFDSTNFTLFDIEKNGCVKIDGKEFININDINK